MAESRIGGGGEATTTTCSSKRVILILITPLGNSLAELKRKKLTNSFPLPLSKAKGGKSTTYTLP